MVRRHQFHHWVGKGLTPPVFIGTNLMRKTLSDLCRHHSLHGADTYQHNVPVLPVPLGEPMHVNKRLVKLNTSTCGQEHRSQSRKMTEQRKKITSLEHLSRMAISVTYLFSFIPAWVPPTPPEDMLEEEKPPSYGDDSHTYCWASVRYDQKCLQMV